ncbi:hypothetical protein TEA_023839 [Camellia sinensis var. sinensis]|uniref:Pentatricopeptide repeat-containing protein n=1 Tax=Camellia sinensis var. sinensis TaxID=542762 RepID=A0A4S4EFR4_CAMSN|nr:hypothetical protein TEA_023839 [Camellia sinensis var. sinensis]
MIESACSLLGLLAHILMLPIKDSLEGKIGLQLWGSSVAICPVVDCKQYAPSDLLNPGSFWHFLVFCIAFGLNYVTSYSPTSPPPPLPAAVAVIPKQRCNSGPNDLQSALISFNRMLQMRPLPPISQFNKALGPITKMGHYAISLSLILNKLQQCQGIQVDLYTFNIAINCYCRLNQVHFGFSLLGSLFKRGFTPDATTFNTLINGLILEDKTPEAVELFKKLITTREIEPDLVMYGTVVNGLCRTGNTIRAVSLLRIMEEGRCKPSIVVYNTIIDSLCKDRMMDDAVKLFTEMDEKDIFPDVVTYNSLIHGLCNFGRWEEATEMLREMLDSGIAPNVRTFNVLVAACTKEGMMNEAEGVLEVMIQRGVDPDVVTYNTLMDGYCLQRHMDEAIRLFNTIVDRGLHPDVVSYNILINGYCKKMKIDEAMHIFREMPRRGLKPNIGTFNTMLQGLFRSSRCGAAQELFNEMQVVGIIPNSQTYDILLDGLCKNGHISKALSLFHMMERNGLDLDVVMYSILINTFCKDKKLDTARALFNNLSSKGLHPDVKTYTMMIHGLCKEGLLHEAKELFVKMEHSGCLADDVTYNTIIRGFIRQHKCYEALILTEEMVQRGFSADASTFPLIVDILSTKGQDPALQEVIQKFMPKDSHGMQENEDTNPHHDSGSIDVMQLRADVVNIFNTLYVMKTTNKIAYKFKTKLLEHKDLMRAVFTGATATGKHHWTPGEKPVDVGEGESDSVESPGLAPFTEPYRPIVNSPPNSPTIDLEEVEPGTKRKKGCSSSGKSKKVSSGASVLADSFNHLSKAVEAQKHLTVRHGTGALQKYSIEPCMQRLMAISDFISTPLFHFACTALENADYREILMCMPDDENVVDWLAQLQVSKGLMGSWCNLYFLGIVQFDVLLLFATFLLSPLYDEIWNICHGRCNIGLCCERSFLVFAIKQVVRTEQKKVVKVQDEAQELL